MSRLSKWNLLAVTALAVIVVTGVAVFTASNRDSSFSFLALGDIGNNDRSQAVLQAIGSNDSDFSIVLGDLGYVGVGNEADWCRTVEQSVGLDYPFQFVVGNHDDGTSDGDIRGYIECLPNHMNGVAGDYGIEYYFDYADLARFILISPDINNLGYDYSKGSEHYTWVADAIDEARAAGIPWVVLGMHKNCITPGIKKCEIGEDLLNLAIEKTVDLVLQAHEHSYFRSYQLANGTIVCPQLRRNEFNINCISNDTDSYVAGEGTVIVIAGTGGRELRDANFADVEIDYFSALNAANSEPSYGFVEFNVTSKMIEAKFVPVLGQFEDSFKIEYVAD